jgi:putative Mg2+ transporter-C (MgtC) family protein
MMAGSGAWEFALLLTAMVVFVNLGLRPLVKFLKRHTRAGMPLLRAYRIVVTVGDQDEALARSLLLRTVALGGLHLSEIALAKAAEGPGLDLSATVTAEGVGELALDQAVQRLAAEPGLLRVRWETQDDA